MEQRPYTIRDLSFWKVALSLALASFFIFASMYAVQPLLPVFVEAFGVSVSTSSLALSMTVAGLIVGLILFGFLSDRLGRTVFIWTSLIGTIIPFFVIPLWDSFIWLMLLRLIQGFALAGVPAASLAYISEEIDQRSVGTATGFYISSNALGGMVGRVLTGYITDHYTWQAAFFVLAGIGVVILFAVLLLLPNSRHFKPSHLSIKKDIVGFLVHLKNPLLLPVFGLGVILQYSFTGMWTYLPFHLEGEPFNLSLDAISYTFLAYSLGVIGSPLAGWLAGHFGLKKVRLTGVFVLSLGTFLTLFTSLPMMIVGLCVACLGFFSAHSLTATSVSETATHHKGSASSLYLVSYYIGVSLGSSLMAPVWEGGGWMGVILTAGILPSVYVLMIQLIKKK